MRRPLFPALALAAAATCAQAQTPVPASPPPAPEEIGRRSEELRGLQEKARVSDEEKRRQEAEVERMRADRARLSAALIDTAARTQAAETRARDVETRLDVLTGSQSALAASLESRRGLIAQVLAAAQRMGRRPPPAILADPDDMLRAIRSAMMLGAVLPQLREETEALASDLKEMTRLREAIAQDKARLEEETRALATERERLAALVEERKGALGTAEQALAQSRARASEFARQATSLKDLIGRMEREASAEARAVDAAARAEAARRQEAAAQVRAKLALAPALDPARLTPGASFAQIRGRLAYPAAGEIVKAFGAPDGFGGAEKGLSIKAWPGATVTAPADGHVVFAGPWRSWGRLLILDAGEGYYLVLAGLARVDVEVGQFVLAGEPVGAMGEGAARAAAAVAIGGADPVLYVEFRKDGAAIDPGPWWARKDARPDVRPENRQDGRQDAPPDGRRDVGQDSEKVRG
jgi:septal ring factor EnvC (AmiA/AmiB activator)